jgi:hypothetical protein
LLVLRVLVLIAAIAIGVALLLFLFTRERRYLQFALRLLQYAVLAALIVFGLLLFERLAVLV